MSRNTRLAVTARHLVIGAAAATSLAFAAHGETSEASEAALPGSMHEFVNWHLDRGACGTWTNTGVTEDMWVGIPAGIEMTNTQTTWYDVPSGELFNSHRMVTADGTVISTGTNVMTWDADRKTVVSAGSGFDMGKPYHGTSVLTGMTADSLTWEYTEMSQGKTTVYENVVTFTGPNTRTNSVRVKGGGDPWTSEMTRTNPAKAMLADTGLVGNWDQSNPDGSIYRQAVSWIGDGHVLKFEGMVKQPGGEWRNDNVFLWFWDPAYDHVSTLFLDQHGTVIHGKVDSLTRDGDVVTIVSSHEGSRFNGLTMSTQLTQVIDGDTLTGTFQGMSLDGIRHGLNWSETPQVSKRAK